MVHPNVHLYSFVCSWGLPTYVSHKYMCYIFVALAKYLERLALFFLKTIPQVCKTFSICSIPWSLKIKTNHKVHELEVIFTYMSIMYVCMYLCMAMYVSMHVYLRNALNGSNGKRSIQVSHYICLHIYWDCKNTLFIFEVSTWASKIVAFIGLGWNS